MAYGPKVGELYRRCGDYVAKIVICSENRDHYKPQRLPSGSFVASFFSALTFWTISGRRPADWERAYATARDCFGGGASLLLTRKAYSHRKDGERDQTTAIHS